MKKTLLFLCCLSFCFFGCQNAPQQTKTSSNAIPVSTSNTPMTPEQLAQQQLDGYNARDIDLFMEAYSEDIEIYNFPDQLSYTGKDKMRENYKKMFENTPNLHCELVSRMVLGNTVIDQEKVTGFSNGLLEAIAIYKIENNKIAKVYFVQKE